MGELVIACELRVTAGPLATVYTLTQKWRHFQKVSNAIENESAGDHALDNHQEGNILEATCSSSPLNAILNIIVDRFPVIIITEPTTGDKLL